MSVAILSALLILGAADAKPAKDARTVELSVTDKGFEPDNVKVKKGEPVHLVVTRKTDQTCATEIVIKDLGIKKELPLNKAVAIDFTPKKTGEINYVCGMDMMGGKLVVQ
jgi:plastocyanin domain-containing protein